MHFLFHSNNLKAAGNPVLILFMDWEGKAGRLPETKMKSTLKTTLHEAIFAAPCKTIFDMLVI
jgi:hypothetical protein